jgi:hypothetical protein
MIDDYQEAVDKMSIFYSKVGKKMVSRVNVLQKILSEKHEDEYIKPPTPYYFKVSLLIRK